MCESCKSCKDYSFERDVDVTNICCLRGYWHYSESPGKVEGSCPKDDEVPPCRKSKDDFWKVVNNIERDLKEILGYDGDSATSFRAAKKYRTNVPFDIDEQFFNGLARLDWLKEREESKLLTKFHIISEANDSSTALISPYAGALKTLYLLAKERIVKGTLNHEGQLEQTGRDRHLPQRLEEILKSSSNLPACAKSCIENTDLAHTIASLGYLINICDHLKMQGKIDDKDVKIVVSAMIVHDCAYPITTSYKDFTSPENRKKHMENAVKEFEKYAQMVNQKHKDFFSDEDIRKICKIVGQHDNPGLDMDFDYADIKPEIIWAHREADRLWMLDRSGFALDLLREIVEKGKYDPKARLAYVINDHNNEVEKYQKFKDKCRHARDVNNRSFYRTDQGYFIYTSLVNQIKNDYDITLPL